MNDVLRAIAIRYFPVIFFIGCQGSLTDVWKNLAVQRPVLRETTYFIITDP